MGPGVGPGNPGSGVGPGVGPGNPGSGGVGEGGAGGFTFITVWALILWFNGAYVSLVNSPALPEVKFAKCANKSGSVVINPTGSNINCSIPVESTSYGNGKSSMPYVKSYPSASNSNCSAVNCCLWSNPWYERVNISSTYISPVLLSILTFWPIKRERKYSQCGPITLSSFWNCTTCIISWYTLDAKLAWSTVSLLIVIRVTKSPFWSLVLVHSAKLASVPSGLYSTSKFKGLPLTCCDNMPFANNVPSLLNSGCSCACNSGVTPVPYVGITKFVLGCSGPNSLTILSDCCFIKS